MYHLDTNIVVAYFNGNHQVAEQLKMHLPDVAISALVLGELLYGARASARSVENLQRVWDFLQIVGLADFDQAAADVYSHIRLSLRQKGRPTGEVDALIAAVALAGDAILITHNARHFEHIEGLQLQDWLTQGT
jgi:tRNA(fMet)-specific endonuclease VapC